MSNQGDICLMRAVQMTTVTFHTSASFVPEPSQKTDAAKELTVVFVGRLIDAHTGGDSWP